MFFGIYGVGIVDFGEAIIKIGLNPGGQLHNVSPFATFKALTLLKRAFTALLQRNVAAFKRDPKVKSEDLLNGIGGGAHAGRWALKGGGPYIVPNNIQG